MRDRRNVMPGQPRPVQLELIAVPIPAADGDANDSHPGGSAGTSRGSGGGGGSRQIYTGHRSPVRRAKNSAPAAPTARPADVRLAELRALGLNRTLMAMAERIGFEPFMAAWEVLSSSEQVLENGHRLLVPAYSTYLRYQRNLLIRQLREDGLTPAQIAHEVLVRTGQKITPGWVQRMLEKA